MVFYQDKVYNIQIRQQHQQFLLGTGLKLQEVNRPETWTWTWSQSLQVPHKQHTNAAFPLHGTSLQGHSRLEVPGKRQLGPKLSWDELIKSSWYHVVEMWLKSKVKVQWLNTLDNLDDWGLDPIRNLLLVIIHPNIVFGIKWTFNISVLKLKNNTFVMSSGLKVTVDYFYKSGVCVNELSSG